MPFQVSPGLYSREIDLSLYAPALATTIVGCVGGARKGPLNELVSVTSIPELTDKLGLPTTQAGYAAVQYLRKGSALWFIRVGDDDAAASEATLVDSSSGATLYVRAVSPGTWADGIVVVVTAGSVAGVKLTVLEGRVAREAYDNVTKANFATSVTGSSYITLADANPSNTNNPKSGQTLTLAGGDDGLTGLNDADYIGTEVGDVATGLQLFANPESVDINILVVPGVSSAAVIEAGYAITEGRRDSVFLADPPLGLTTQEVIDWHNGAGSFTDHAAFSSSYAALQWAWHEVYDPYTNQKVWVAPSGPTLAIYAYSDYTTETWFAPAGLTRGLVDQSLDLEHSPSKGQRDLLSGNGNCVNPYIKMSKHGIVLWGQRTLQRYPSATDRVNVRRLLCYVEKVFATAAVTLPFDPNDKTLWRRFELLGIQTLEPVKARRGLYDYRVVCDESTNPSAQIDQNKMTGKLLVKPTKAAEVIQIDWVLLSTGMEFNELA